MIISPFYNDLIASDIQNGQQWFLTLLVISGCQEWQNGQFHTATDI